MALLVNQLKLFSSEFSEISLKSLGPCWRHRLPKPRHALIMYRLEEKYLVINDVNQSQLGRRGCKYLVNQLELRAVAEQVGGAPWEITWLLQGWSKSTSWRTTRPKVASAESVARFSCSSTDRHQSNPLTRPWEAVRNSFIYILAVHLIAIMQWQPNSASGWLVIHRKITPCAVSYHSYLSPVWVKDEGSIETIIDNSSLFDGHFKYYMDAARRKYRGGLTSTEISGMINYAF